MSKKSNKAKPAPSSHNYKSNDVVLAKLRGYPPWPGMIIDESDVPSHVTKERPNVKKGPGSTFCIRFFPLGDYSWMSPKEISLLQKHEIEAYINEPHKKNGDLLDGYKVALDPTEWLAKKKDEAENATAYDPAGEVDELEDEEDADGEEDTGRKKGTKRKRDGEAKTKPRKSAGSGDKAKRTKKGVKSAEGVESEDETKPLKKPRKDTGNDDPETRRVREWRQALQRVFLGKTRPKDEEMENHNKMFTDVENYTQMALPQLQETKIGKVMRHISMADEEKLPRNAEFNFKSRAAKLVDRWQAIAEKEQKTNGTQQVNGDSSPNAAADQSAMTADVTMATDANGDVEPTPAEPTTNGLADAEMKVDA